MSGRKPIAKNRLTLERIPGGYWTLEGGEMSSGCASSGGPSNDGLGCPVSGTKGSGVERQTVKALLTEVALRGVTMAAHRFCPDPACDVVYFDEDGRTYSKVISGCRSGRRSRLVRA